MVVSQLQDTWESLPALFEKSLEFKQLTRKK